MIDEVGEGGRQISCASHQHIRRRSAELPAEVQKIPIATRWLRRNAGGNECLRLPSVACLYERRRSERRGGSLSVGGRLPERLSAFERSAA